MLIQAVLIPVFVQVGLTFAILIGMGYYRNSAVNSGTLDWQDISLGERKWPVRAQQFANNFSNQFELPVLFYVVVALAIPLRKADLLFSVLAWLFVISRIGHAFVHTTFNRVKVRGAVYAVGVLCVLLMWIKLAIGVLVGD